LQIIFQGRRKTGLLDLEAVEMAARSAMHRAGAALNKLLDFPAPAKAQGWGRGRRRKKRP